MERQECPGVAAEWQDRTDNFEVEPAGAAAEQQALRCAAAAGDLNALARLTKQIESDPELQKRFASGELSGGSAALELYQNSVTSLAAGRDTGMEAFQANTRDDAEALQVRTAAGSSGRGPGAEAWRRGKAGTDADATADLVEGRAAAKEPLPGQEPAEGEAKQPPHSGSRQPTSSSPGRPPRPPRRPPPLPRPPLDGSGSGGSRSPTPKRSQAEAEDAAQESPAAAPGKPGGLPGKESFRRAEALCGQQRFEEAIPLFDQVLHLLRERGASASDRDCIHIAQADVWAHRGVAMQSLDRMQEALTSYSRAVSLNPRLHACFANLAALHSYLKDHRTAKQHIDSALSIEPQNDAYLQIRGQIEEQIRANAGTGAGQAGADEGEGKSRDGLA